ncbi:MAG: hypothetical protein K6E63_05140 [Lachnospiraceae bacterium]|nr:hypothetical protein [Lachnospiraceae bacterium]
MFFDEDDLTLYYALLTALEENRMPLDLKYSSRDFKELDDIINRGEKIILYGAGAMCDYFLNKYDHPIKYIVDRKVEEGKKSFCGYHTVLPVKRLIREDRNTPIVITPVKASQEICNFLESAGFNNLFILASMEYRKDAVKNGVAILKDNKEEQERYRQIWRRKQRNKLENKLRLGVLESEIKELKREIRVLQGESFRRSINTVTKCGKFSYGPLCKHFLVEEIGSFTSVAEGTDVVPNHAMGYISTHPMIYWSPSNGEGMTPYEDCKGADWYFEGVKPLGKADRKKIKVGNDVWIGRNVLITNNSNIGNGAIIGAGSVVTKDVPDYAVVAGAPARIIRYRYSPEQIEALNKIEWWNWDDDKIRENYEDFFLPVDEFIAKHLKG